jgi:hypothetical protein
VKNGSVERFPQDSDLSFQHLAAAVLEIFRQEINNDGNACIWIRSRVFNRVDSAIACGFRIVYASLHIFAHDVRRISSAELSGKLW